MEIRRQGDILVVVPHNEVDMSVANILSKNVIEGVVEKTVPVVLDLSNVKYVNSAAIGVIINLYKSYAAKKVDLYFFKPRKAVMDIFEATGLQKIFKVYRQKKDLPKALGFN